MDKLKRILLALLLLPLVAGCVGARLVTTPTSAPPTPNVEATVEAAVKAALTGTAQTPVAQVPVPTPTPLPVQALGWEGVTVQTLCLEVEQSYPQIEEKISEPITETVRRILARVGLQVVDERVPCDATLTVVLTSQALGANYGPMGTGGNYCYTGAQANGQVTFAIPGRPPLSISVAGSSSPSSYTTDRLCPHKPSDAPFDKAWLEAVLDGLSHLWGSQVLIQGLLKDEEWVVRWRAAEALGRFRPETTEGELVLIQALGDETKEVREAAARALGEIGPAAKEAIPALIQTLGDEYWEVREAAAKALGGTGPMAKESVAGLIRQAMKDEKQERRQGATWALGAIGPREGVIPALIQILEHDESGEVRAAAAEALGDIGPEAVEAIPALIQVLEEESDYLRSTARTFGTLKGAAERALNAITGRDFGRDVARWQKWWEENNVPAPTNTPTATPVSTGRTATPSTLPMVSPTPTPLPLPQPGIVGPVDAGGNAEVVIINDTPYELTVNLDGPDSQSLEVTACQTCSVYNGIGPSSCQVAGRPQATVRIPPGDYEVSAQVNAPGVLSFAGQWTLLGDNSYQSCFFIVTQ
jgi:hypothetical protein